MLAYSDIWDLLAIVAAAERMKTDVIVGSNSRVATMLGVEVCQAMVAALNVRSRVSLFNELDHSDSVPLCIRAVDAGYPLVMIDGSQKPLAENIKMTSEVVEYAHRKGVAVEGEVGKIGGYSAEGSFGGGTFLTEVGEAVELVKKTGVDMLAVGIGTAHGFYTERPKIHFDRLREIAAAVEIPLVMHGGTGIPDEDIRKGVSLGITKVNVGTIIHTTYLHHLKEELAAGGERPYTLDIMAKVLPHIEDVVADRIRVIAGKSAVA
jgi:ketose-bisphosphate aldolase